MRHFNDRLRAGRSRAAWTTTLGLLTFAAVLALTLGGSAGAAATPVLLGAADSFSVLAGAGVTNTGPTTLGGDIGTFPTTSITGTATLTVLGVNHGGDAVTQQAKTDLLTASTTAAGQGPASPIVANLGGQTLVPGVYNSASSIGLTGTVTLDGAGDQNAVFVFQAGSTLTTASTSQVNLINGARACNVFWQVGSSATLGTGSTFRGSILASDSITVTTGVTIVGRVLASSGAVTLDTDTISAPSCGTPTPTDTASREIYCDAAGTSYNLVVGQDKLPPYDKLGLVPALIDPVTGSKSCRAPLAATSTTTTTTTTTTPTTTTPTSTTPSGPTPKQIAAAKAKKRAAAAKAKRIAAARARRIAAGSTSTKITRTAPKPARHHPGFTG
jgi:hypothetical protein